MNFYHLKYFYDAVAEGSIGQAAKKNFVSQSAVSQAVRRLEEALDCDLLIHQKNRFVLTDSGRAVYEKCQAIFQSVEDLKVEAKVAKKEFVGSISFATSHSIALAILPAFIAELKKRYPSITPKFRLGKTPIVKRWLEDREIDFAITVDDGHLKSFEKIVVHTGEFIVIRTKKQSFISRSHGFILTESRPETEALKKAYQNAHRKELPLALEVDSWEIIKRLTLEGLGMGFIPAFAMGRGDQKRLTVLKENAFPKIKYDLCVVQNPGQPMSRLCSLFLSELQGHLQS